MFVEDYLAEQVLLEFPCEVVGAILAGRWAAAASPLRPWFLGYRLRLVMAAAVTCLVSISQLASEPQRFSIQDA